MAVRDGCSVSVDTCEKATVLLVLEPVRRAPLIRLDEPPQVVPRHLGLLHQVAPRCRPNLRAEYLNQVMGIGPGGIELLRLAESGVEDCSDECQSGEQLRS